jgi:hypothetical protein
MLKKITLTDISLTEVQILQNEVHLFTHYIQNNKLKEDFLNSIISLDISFKIWYFLRTRVESNKKEFRLNFNLSEAATIMKCCNYNHNQRDDLDRITMLKISAQIDQQLKNL